MEEIESDIVKQKQLRDAQENQEFDDAVAGGTLEDLREGVKIRQKEKLLGSRMLDAIEYGAVGSVKWLQKQAEEDPDRYTDDMLRLLGGGLKNIGWALSKVPFLDKIAQGEDWLAEQARAMSAQLTPQLDPRFAGWGTRVATGLIADKGISKAYKVANPLLKQSLLNNINRKAGFVYADNIPNQIERMATAYAENKHLIPVKNRLVAGTKRTTEHLVDEDLISKVAKSINKNVSDEAINTAFKTQKSEFNSTTKAVGYMNRLAKNLLTEFEGKNLREWKFADVDGVTKIVDAKASGKKVRAYEWAFEKDHRKAKEAFKKAGIDKLENLGADFYENLELGLTTFNRRKNFAAGNPVIPDKLSEFLGISTDLTMQVRKSIDADFAASMSKIPTRYRQVIQTQILEELVYAQDKLKKGLTKKKFIKLLDKQIAEKAELFEDVSFINTLNIIDEHVTGPARKELLDQSIKNPQVILDELQNNKSWRLKSEAEKAKDISAVQRWIERNRGYGANEASKRARFYGYGHEV